MEKTDDSKPDGLTDNLPVGVYWFLVDFAGRPLVMEAARLDKLCADV